MHIREIVGKVDRVSAICAPFLEEGVQSESSQVRDAAQELTPILQSLQEARIESHVTREQVSRTLLELGHKINRDDLGYMLMCTGYVIQWNHPDL